uniref:Uncharacterized protein n=1 Tax=Poecilia latipinna TaxID=48699 RepID=A0A3B3VAY2_9TELE
FPNLVSASSRLRGHLPVSQECIADLQQLLLHRVSDQLCSQSSCSAGQIIGGDGKRSLSGIQRPLQPLLHHQQRLRVGLQQLDVPLQLRLPGVDLLESLSKKTRSCGLGFQSCSLRVLAQGSGLQLDVLGVSVVGTGLPNLKIGRDAGNTQLLSTTQAETRALRNASNDPAGTRCIK